MARTKCGVRKAAMGAKAVPPSMVRCEEARQPMPESSHKKLRFLPNLWFGQPSPSAGSGKAKGTARTWCGLRPQSRCALRRTRSPLRAPQHHRSSRISSSYLRWRNLLGGIRGLTAATVTSKAKEKLRGSDPEILTPTAERHRQSPPRRRRHPFFSVSEACPLVLCLVKERD